MKLFLKLKLYFFIIFLAILEFSFVFCKRVSEKGQECVIPFTYYNQIYTDCAYSSLYKNHIYPKKSLFSLR